jgi:hypothetical protein
MNITRAQLKQIIKEESQRFLKESYTFDYEEGYLTMEEKDRYIKAINSMYDAIEVLQRSDDSEMQELAKRLDKAHDALSDALTLIGIS